VELLLSGFPISFISLYFPPSFYVFISLYFPPSFYVFISLSPFSSSTSAAAINSYLSIGAMHAHAWPHAHAHTHIVKVMDTHRLIGTDAQVLEVGQTRAHS
jgi:hypothetical protein